MICENCSKEATYSCDCLVINHTVNSTSMRIGTAVKTTTMKTESAAGVEKVGLCDDCLKKAKWKNRHMFMSWKLGCVLGLGLPVGILLGLIGMFNKNNTGGIPALETAGGILALTSSVLYMIFYFILDPIKTMKKLKESPYMAFHKLRIKNEIELDQDGSRQLLVPIGENYYKDKDEFDDVNSLLMTETKKKVYDNIGKWKELSSLSSLLNLLSNAPASGGKASPAPAPAVKSAPDAVDTLMVYLDIDKLGGGVYGYAAGKVVAQAAPVSMLEGVSVSSGDSNATLYGSQNEYVVGLTGRRSVLDAVKEKLLADHELKELLSKSGIRMGGSEPLVADGSVQNGSLLGSNSWCAQGFRDAWKKPE